MVKAVATFSPSSGSNSERPEGEEAVYHDYCVSVLRNCTCVVQSGALLGGAGTLKNSKAHQTPKRRGSESKLTASGPTGAATCFQGMTPQAQALGPATRHL